MYHKKSKKMLGIVPAIVWGIKTARDIRPVPPDVTMGLDADFIPVLPLFSDRIYSSSPSAAEIPGRKSALKRPNNNIQSIAKIK